MSVVAQSGLICVTPDLRLKWRLVSEREIEWPYYKPPSLSLSLSLSRDKAPACRTSSASQWRIQRVQIFISGLCTLDPQSLQNRRWFTRLP